MSENEPFPVCQSYSQIYQDLYQLFYHVNLTNISKDFNQSVQRVKPITHKEIAWIFAIFITLATTRRLIQKSVVKTIGTRLALSHKDSNRWFYNVWQLAYYTTTSSLALYHYLVHMGANPMNRFEYYVEEILPNIKTFNYGYLDYFVTVLSLGYYMDASYWLITDSNMLFRRRETIILLFHHFISTTTILLAYKTGNGIFVAYIFLFVDPCDIFIHSTKLVDLIINRSNHELKSSQWLDSIRSISFFLFVVSWVFLRIYKLPRCFHSMSLAYYTRHSVEPFPFVVLMNINHVVLMSMNLYWSFTLALIIYRFVRFQISADKSKIDESLAIQEPINSGDNDESHGKSD